MNERGLDNGEFNCHFSGFFQLCLNKKYQVEADHVCQMDRTCGNLLGLNESLGLIGLINFTALSSCCTRGWNNCWINHPKSMKKEQKLFEKSTLRSLHWKHYFHCIRLVYIQANWKSVNRLLIKCSCIWTLLILKRHLLSIPRFRSTLRWSHILTFHPILVLFLCEISQRLPTFNQGRSIPVYQIQCKDSRQSPTWVRKIRCWSKVALYLQVSMSMSRDWDADIVVLYAKNDPKKSR